MRNKYENLLKILMKDKNLAQMKKVQIEINQVKTYRFLKSMYSIAVITRIWTYGIRST